MKGACLAKSLLKLTNKNIKVGLDIGGSLTKIAVALYKQEKDFTLIRNRFLNEFDFMEEIELDENFLYIKNFQTNKFKTDTVAFLKKINDIQSLSQIYATGGGAHKFYDLINEEFEIKMEKHDELLSLVKGYILMNNYRSFYELKDGQIEIVSNEDIVYPHLAVNVGSGVSILQVNGVHDIQRVTGTLMGGGTLIGLSKLLINVDNYNDIMKLAKQGENKNVDLLVKDIYGSKNVSSSIGLESDIIASSFGKIHQFIRHDEKDKLKKEDIAKSLLVMICYHITQLAYLVSKQNNINRVYYFGNFSRKNSYAIEWLEYATKFWNKDLQVRFNIYDGFLGSIGTLIECENEI